MLCISWAKFSFISLWLLMHAIFFYFYPTTVKYSVLTASWALIALDNTACSRNLIFHTGTTWEKYYRRHCWGDGCSAVASVTGSARVCPDDAGRAAGRGSVRGRGSRAGDGSFHHWQSPEVSAHPAVEQQLRKHPGCCSQHSGTILTAGTSELGAVPGWKSPELRVCVGALRQRTESSCVL